MGPNGPPLADGGAVTRQSTGPLTRRQVLTALGGLGVVVAGGCGRQPAASAPPDPARGTSVARPVHIEVTAFGAVGNGRTDDTAALKRALAYVRAGQTLVFPAGHTFLHSAVLSVGTAGVALAGPGTLSATNESASALRIDADHVTLQGLGLAVPHTTRRWSAPDQHRLYLGPHRGAVVRGVQVTGSAAAGIFCDGAEGFTLDRVKVSDTRADGIHMTGGANGGTITAPQIARSGDDGVAVVSYLADHAICSDITVTAPSVHTTTGGRGLSVVGGTRITYSDIDVRSSSAAGVYLACEGAPYFTADTTAVKVTSGRITGANTDAGIDHGAVLVFAGRSGGNVSGVSISMLDISGTRAGASRQIGVVQDSGGTAAGILFKDLRLSALPTPYEGNAPLSELRLVDVTAGGKPVTP